jgi:hypothetical protein
VIRDVDNDTSPKGADLVRGYADATLMTAHGVDQVACQSARVVVDLADRSGDLLEDGVRIDPDGPNGHA